MACSDPHPGHLTGFHVDRENPFLFPCIQVYSPVFRFIAVNFTVTVLPAHRPCEAGCASEEAGASYENPSNKAQPKPCTTPPQICPSTSAGLMATPTSCTAT